ncbi:Hypothetical protein SRAE_2000143100 [Strongyloides ratti]|uniref:DUF4780 domain-containing protein n=1 Tax=Strongyloides ratti TaxID=34506 RepID=A0A090LH22_STRRB|nr:Hypothetical protein SRAE_2000143100 [Strongyloides ratti]CEF66765.1 Hypothetical protein SRAE_2000143100 [Strongyloides ratti]
MSEKTEQIKKIKCLEKALTLLKYKKEIVGYSCNRSLSKDCKENIILSIEFEIPDNLVVDSDSSSSFGNSSNYSKVSGTFRKNDSNCNVSISTSESSLPSESFNKNCLTDNSVNYKALNNTTTQTKIILVEIKIYIRSYVQNEKYDGILKRIDVELNPLKATPREIIKTLFPKKDPLKIIQDGVYFIKEDFDVNKEYKKALDWIICYPYELDMPLVTIYGSTILKDFKMSFVIDDITRI